MNLDLTGKKAIVCGASKGIGRAAAAELASLGATVTVLARTEASLASLVGEMAQKHGQKHEMLAVDLSQTESARRLVSAHVAEKGPFHILINNSGGPPGGPAHTAKPDDFLSAFTQHLVGSHIMMQSVLGGMKAEKYGRIINIISTSVKQPVRGLGVSNTVRGAVASWAKTLANELGEYGITVNNILPGYTDTDRLWEVLKMKASQSGASLESVAEGEKQNVPLRRFGRAEETAQAIAFLASPAAGYINGINLPVDGGRTGSL